MKGTTTSLHLQTLVKELFYELFPSKKPAPKGRPGKKPPTNRSQRQARKEFSYYMQLIDYDSQEPVGHLADISSGGFKMDSTSPIPPNKEYRFRLDLTKDVADKPNMIFIARSRWCQPDPLDPFYYNVGFQLINIAPGDLEIFNRMIEKYGKKKEKLNSIDLRHSNKW